MNNISVIIPNPKNNISDELIGEIKKIKPLEIIIINNDSQINNTNNILKYYNISGKKKCRDEQKFWSFKSSRGIFTFHR